MGTVIIREWEVTVSVTITFTEPIEDDEGEDAFRAWLLSPAGYAEVEKELKRARLNPKRFPHVGEMEIDNIEVKETEVKSTDTDPRV